MIKRRDKFFSLHFHLLLNCIQISCESEKISILRLDTDFYESTKVELEVLFPKLISGGFLIIDDYGHWKGARKAVDEFFNGKEWLHYVDYSCRYIIKK